MCGINGIYNYSDLSKSLENVEFMNMVSVHRGPDFSGIYNDDKIILGHNRLSIIDLENEINKRSKEEDFSIPYEDYENTIKVIYKMRMNRSTSNKKDSKEEVDISNPENIIEKYLKMQEDLKKANEELSEGERALARDKSTDQPKKYVSGLSDKDKESHDRHLKKQGKKSDSDKSAYKQSPADKKAKTIPSKHTKKFKQMYGEDYLNEKIKGLETKAKKSGMPYSILKKVYDRGMAAWKGGHRPGTTPQQWAFARVNSFTTKSSGTWGKADSDLAKQVRGS